MKSSLFCEIAYSSSKLFELFNDCLLKGKFPSLSGPQENRIKVKKLFHRIKR